MCETVQIHRSSILDYIKYARVWWMFTCHAIVVAWSTYFPPSTHSLAPHSPSALCVLAVRKPTTKLTLQNVWSEKEGMRWQTERSYNTKFKSLGVKVETTKGHLQWSEWISSGKSNMNTQKSRNFWLACTAPEFYREMWKQNGEKNFWRKKKSEKRLKYRTHK